MTYREAYMKCNTLSELETMVKKDIVAVKLLGSSDRIKVIKDTAEEVANLKFKENEATREMTFEEEYQILQKEKEELFAMENCDSEPPFANSVVRRASRCIRKLLEEIQQYRAIGTIEEFKTLKNKHIGKDNMVISSSDLMTILNSDSEELKQYKEVGTVEELKDLKEKSVAKKPHSISIANDIGNSMVECPICHARSDYDVKSIKRGYCWKCGQKLDWSE